MSDYRDPEHFERLYQRDPDPWRFATSDYERDKYAATLAALPAPRFARAFEVGCSIGVLTAALAGRCDRLLAVDVAASALAQARARCAALPQVEIVAMRVPDEWPSGDFDLIVISEVLYYLGLDGIDRTAERARQSLRPGGCVVLVNWHGATDGACSGDEAAERFLTRARLPIVAGSRAAQYRLDVLGG